MEDKYRAILLRTMKDFIRFCDAENLNWYLAFGSAIGAERHKGMIPWDDDIDVYMPRPDYERFLSMAGKVNDLVRGLDGKYDILSTRTGTPDYPVAIAKFSDMNTTIWEQEKYPCVFGVFVDVFPLDAVGNDMEQNARAKNLYVNAFKNYRRSLRHYEAGDVLKTLVQCRFSKFAGMLKDILVMRPRKSRFLERFNDMDRSMAGSEGDMLMTMPSYSPTEKVCHPKAWYDGYKSLPFEDFEVRVPAENDAVLRRIYGDYMQLPPKYERISTHGRYYMNLDRRLSVDEVKELLRSGKGEKYSAGK